MTEDIGVTFKLDEPLLGDGCDVIAVFPDGRKKRIAFGTENAARDWVRRGAARWFKTQQRKRRATRPRLGNIGEERTQPPAPESTSARSPAVVGAE